MKLLKEFDYWRIMDDDDYNVATIYEQGHAVVWMYNLLHNQKWWAPHVDLWYASQEEAAADLLKALS